MSRLKLAACAVGFAMMGALALAQTATNDIPTGGNGANSTPYTEGTLNGNHGSSSMSSAGGHGSMSNGAGAHSDNAINPNPGLRSSGAPAKNSQGGSVTPSAQ